MVIAVDFDGTIVENKYPEIGQERPFAIETLKMLIRDRHQLVLWTCREGELLDNALQWCRERGVEFYAANRDYPEETTDNNPISPANSKPTSSSTTVMSAVCPIGEPSIAWSPMARNGATSLTRHTLARKTMASPTIIIKRNGGSFE